MTTNPGPLIAHRAVLTTCLVAFTCAVAGAHAQPKGKGDESNPGVAKKVGGAVERGVKVAASGVDRGVRAAASGARKAGDAVERGAKAAGNAVSGGAKKIGVPGVPSGPASAPSRQAP